ADTRRMLAQHALLASPFFSGLQQVDGLHRRRSLPRERRQPLHIGFGNDGSLRVGRGQITDPLAAERQWDEEGALALELLSIEAAHSGRQRVLLFYIGDERWTIRP